MQDFTSHIYWECPECGHFNDQEISVPELNFAAEKMSDMGVNDQIEIECAKCETVFSGDVFVDFACGWNEFGGMLSEHVPFVGFDLYPGRHQRLSAPDDAQAARGTSYAQTCSPGWTPAFRGLLRGCRAAPAVGPTAEAASCAAVVGIDSRAHRGGGGGLRSW